MAGPATGPWAQSPRSSSTSRHQAGTSSLREPEGSSGKPPAPLLSFDGPARQPAAANTSIGLSDAPRGIIDAFRMWAAEDHMGIVATGASCLLMWADELWLLTALIPYTASRDLVTRPQSPPSDHPSLSSLNTATMRRVAARSRSTSSPSPRS